MYPNVPVSGVRKWWVNLRAKRVAAGMTAVLAASCAHAALPAGATATGPVPASQPVTVTLHLAMSPAKTAALQQFLSDVQSPSSKSYHQWLTPQQFAVRFGAEDADIAALSASLAPSGLNVVSVSGNRLSVTVRGTVSAVEAAFAPHLQRVVLGGTEYMANAQTPTLPNGIAAVDGLDTVPQEHGVAFSLDGQATPAASLLSGLTSAVNATSARVLSLDSTLLNADVDTMTQTAVQALLREAAAQGITVLASASMGAHSFPASLSEVFAVNVAGTADTATDALSELRPGWQIAVGLPTDGLRHAPDATVSSLTALSGAVVQILAEQPVTDGAAPRLGNIAGTVYSIATEPGIFEQPDGAAPGTWEALTGLGSTNLSALVKAYPHGSFSTNVTVTPNPYAPVHGSTFTLSSTVTDTSGKGSTTPSGTVTYNITNSSTLAQTTLGPVALANGQASTSTNQLPGGSYGVYAVYSGDASYAASTSTSTGFSIQPEGASITATVATSVPVGGTLTVNGTVRSLSGVGTPGGTLTVQPQNTGNATVYTGTLSGAGGAATATVSVPATQAGTITLLVSCNSSDASFICYTPIGVTATVTKGTSTTALSVSPNPPVSGSTTTFTATVTGATGATAPTGTVTFQDGATMLGSAVVNGSGVAVFTTTTLSGSSHSFTAVYGGDTNYSTSTSPAVSSSGTATTTTLTVSPNPPVNGTTTTLTASIGYTQSGSATPTGTVTFFMDGGSIGTGTVTNGTATFSANNIGSTTTHTFYAVYGGDTTYNTSTSPTVTTPVSGSSATTSATLTVSPNPPVAGSTTTMTTTIGYSNSSGKSPSGTVTFYQDGVQVAIVTVTNASATYTSTAITGKTTHTFYSVYSGDTNFNASTSNTVTTSATGGNSSTTLALTISPNPPVSGSAATLTAVIGYTSSGSTTPTGTVTFYLDGNFLGTGTVANGSATFTSTTLSSTTTHTYYASYPGDGNFGSSTSNTITTNATKNSGTATNTAVTASSTQVITGSTVQLTATVTPTTVVNGTNPTGTVTFSSSTQGVLGSATLSGTTATFTATLTTQGTQSITATYNGDGNYAASTSGTPVAILVGPPTSLTLSVSPTTAITYGSNVNVTALVTAIPNSGAATLNGTVTLTLAGTTQATYTGTLTGLTQTTANTVISFVAPTPGTYIVTATCTGGNFNCNGVTATTTIVVSKANTLTVVTATPSVPVSGQPTQFTATVTPITTVSPSAATPTGTVTFYINGASAGTGTLTGNTATFSTTLNSTTGNTVAAVYGGDNNYNTSTSATLNLVPQPVITITNLVPSVTTGLARSLVVITAQTSVPSTSITSTTTAPAGTVSFYDTYNGQTVLLGTQNLTQSGPYIAVAQLSTTGLLVGVHNLYAIFAGSTSFTTSQSSVTSINLTDYSVALSPSTVTVTQGQAINSVATITALSGFTGQVVLSCTPPAASNTVCTVTPSTLSVQGTATINVVTTVGQAGVGVGQAGISRSVAGLLGLATLLGLFLPARRRRVPVLLAMVAAFTLLSSAGCTTLVNNAGGTSSKGTPKGAQIFVINTSGTDGRTTVEHDTQLQVNVQ